MKYHGYIYRLTLLRDTDSFKAGELYIGKHNGRKNNYYSGGSLIKSITDKHGETIFKREIIAIDIVDETLLNYLEIYYIALYQTNRSKHGINLNLTYGGEGTSGYKLSQDKIDNLSKRIKEEYKIGKRKPAKQYTIYVYDENGKYLTEYENAVEASKAVGGCGSSILKCANNPGKHFHKGLFMSRTKSDTIDIIRNTNCTKVYQFTLLGDFIKSYESIRNAAQENNLLEAAISSNCRELTRSCGNFVWSYDNKFPNFDKHLTKIECFDKDGVLIATTTNCAEMSKLVNYSRHTVNALTKNNKSDKNGRTYKKSYY